MNTVQQVINDAVDFAVRMASDNSHGYSQAVRSLYNITNPTSFDCSSLCCTAYYYAFVKNGLTAQANYLKANCSYTGNMLNMTNVGFEIVARNQDGHTQMQKGDLELNTVHHVAMAIDKDNIVHARSSEGTSDTRDGSGNEIRTQPWYIYSKGWTHRLRFTGKGLNLQTSVSSMNTLSVDGVSLETIAKYINAEFGMASGKDYNCLLGVAQCIYDMWKEGGYGSNLSDVLRFNFTNPSSTYTDDCLRAAKDVFVNGKKRFDDRKILQFRSFSAYGDGKGSYDPVKCSTVLAKYDYIGSDSLSPTIGHLYFGKVVKSQYTAHQTHFTSVNKPLSNVPKYTAVTKETCPVRVWAGKKYDECSFSPLKKGAKVKICDEVKNEYGNTWYYIKYNDKYGFSYSERFEKK